MLFHFNWGYNFEMFFEFVIYQVTVYKWDVRPESYTEFDSREYFILYHMWKMIQEEVIAT